MIIVEKRGINVTKIQDYILCIIFALGAVIILPLKLTAQTEDVISQAPEKLPKNRKERREDRLEKLKEIRELKRERRQEKRQVPSRGQGIGKGRGRVTR